MSRWHTLGWFVLMLVLIFLLIWPSALTGTEDSRPISTDRGSFGLAGLNGWLATAQIRTHSQRLRFTELPPAIAESDGNLLIIHLPTTPVSYTHLTLPTNREV